ncbi:MAG: DDE-type integrase/transposase/recombinase [Verrucomicrobia bacterium]|nr:DDE-type integrase/transposase/recombinase [Verrucomicrobiota bacterium]
MKAVVAQNLILKQQLIVLNRGRKRAPSISPLHRIWLAFFLMFLSARRLQQTAVAFRPSTFLRFKEFLVRQKYKFLFSSGKRSKPGPKGPSREIIVAVVEFKQRNPRCGCPRIAQQLSITFGIDLQPAVVRRILVKHFKSKSGSDGPSWLTFIGHSKDSLWSMDFFKTESILLKSYSVMVVMDQFSRRIIGFAVHRGDVGGEVLCSMFREIASNIPTPKYLSLDNDPLYRFDRWAPELQAMMINPIYSIPLTPVSHPFVERLIGSVRREYLDRLFFWNTRDLQPELDQFRDYFNEHRVHAGIDGDLPNQRADEIEPKIVSFESYSWEPHCNGLFVMPKAA